MVVFVMIDGLRPDALAVTQCPHLKSVIARGASTLRARSSFPPITLPCHTSIFHSVPSSRHGIVNNDWLPMSRPLPGLFEQIKAAGMRSAAFYNWEQLRDVSRPGSLTYSYYCDTSHDPDGDDVTVDVAVRVLTRDPYDFAFVYMGNVDNAGHDYGWMSDGYLAQAERADRALGTLLAALPIETPLLLQADHGGHDKNHGQDIPEDMTIPWMAAGPGIRRGYTISGAVSLLDTAPTLARLLGIAPHAEWEGRCVEEIFDLPA